MFKNLSASLYLRHILQSITFGFIRYLVIFESPSTILIFLQKKEKKSTTEQIKMHGQFWHFNGWSPTSILDSWQSFFFLFFFFRWGENVEKSSWRVAMRIEIKWMDYTSIISDSSHSVAFSFLPSNGGTARNFTRCIYNYKIYFI